MSARRRDDVRAVARRAVARLSVSCVLQPAPYDVERELVRVIRAERRRERRRAVKLLTRCTDKVEDKLGKHLTVALAAHSRTIESEFNQAILGRQAP